MWDGVKAAVETDRSIMRLAETHRRVHAHMRLLWLQVLTSNATGTQGIGASEGYGGVVIQVVDVPFELGIIFRDVDMMREETWDV